MNKKEEMAKLMKDFAFLSGKIYDLWEEDIIDNGELDDILCKYYPIDLQEFGELSFNIQNWYYDCESKLAN